MIQGETAGSGRGGAFRVALLAFALIVLGCLPPGSPALLPKEGAPWEISPAAEMSQHLYRISYQGPEGKLSFRLTFYFGDASSFRMDGADTVGRRLFSLELKAGGAAMWLDHRNEEYCRLAAADLPRALPLARLPLEALPRLLFGRMPATPASQLVRQADKISYLDAAGRSWSGGLDVEGRLMGWTLKEGEEAVAWWTRQGKEGIYSDRKAGLQVRIVEQVAEKLAALPAPILIPENYRENVCGG